VIMARLLTPVDYGMLATAMIFTQPLQTTLLNSTERAIVLQGDLSDASLSSVAFALLGLSVCISAALVTVGLFLGTTFGHVLALLSLSLILAALNLPARACLRLRLQFDRFSLSMLLAQLFGTGGVGIVCALNGLGPYSLVFGMLSQSVIQTMLCWFFSGIKLEPRLNWTYIRAVALLAYQVIRISLLDTTQSQLLWIFGWLYAGRTALGVLNRAYYMIQLPAELLVNALNAVLFTGFSIVKGERERLTSSMRTLVELSCVVIFPLTAGMAAAAPQLVRVVLGSKWGDATALLPWLAIGTACNTTGCLFATMAEAVGRLRAKFFVQLGATTAAILIYFGLARYGIAGSTKAFAATWIVFLVAQLLLGARILEIPVTRFARWLLPGLLSAAVVVICVAALRVLFGNSHPYLLLALEIAGCGVSLLSVLWLFFPALLGTLLRFAGLRAVAALLHLPADAS